MGKKATEGFTKNAQKDKFIRNRDIKMSGKELQHESKIQKLMCEGVCPKCREKVQWKFRYDKYKPLKNIGTCQGCKQKAVTKAYRTLCDKCATSKKACPGCCCDMTDPANQMPSADKVSKMKSSSSTSDSHTEVKDDNEDCDDEEADEDDEEMDEDENEEEGDEESDGEGDDDIDMDDENDENDETIEEKRKEKKKSTMFDSSSSALGDTDAIVNNTSWDAKKFNTFASQKYSKNRIPGTKEDSTIASLSSSLAQHNSSSSSSIDT